MKIETDALIIGAGPVGLFQVFELGLLDIHAHVVDSMPRVGGQCAELYPDKPIYDIPALPVCGAQELIDRLLEQIGPFAPEFHLGQEVTGVVADIDGSFYVRTATGTEFKARSIVVAGGVGSFRARQLGIDGVDAFTDHSLHYKVRDVEALHGKDIVILGGGDSALDWAIDLHDKANSVILVHRSSRFRAAPASVSRMHELCDQTKMQFLQGDVIRVHGKGRQIEQIDVRSADLVTRRIALQQLLVFFGLSPKLGPIADWGLALQNNQLSVDTGTFATNVPGIFAIGDINTYPGKKKLILSGFHEAALASFGVYQHLYPEKTANLQYTTTSPRLHQRLGLKEAS